MSSVLRRELAGLPPGYFALVMATGIVAVAAHLEGWERLSQGLAWLNLVAFAVLWALFLLRLFWFPAAVRRDFSDFHRAPGFFNVVAGTAVVGTQFTLVHHRPSVSLALWGLAVPLWFVATYGVFSRFTVAEEKPTLGLGIDGGWLTSVVATQAVAVLGTLVSPLAGPWRNILLFASLSFWLQGGMLYIWLIALVFYRYIFFRLAPAELTPPYWINMGAMAISTLSGALLVEHADAAPFLATLAPFLEGLTVLFWATATWWIPMLLTLGYWRHVTSRLALSYDPLYWGAVFPLGMYTVCTIHVAGTLGLPALLWIPHVFVYVALTAWTLAAAGLVKRLIRIVTSSS